MINANELKLLLEKYKIDYQKVIGKNPNVITKSFYESVKYVLEYLVDELKIESKNIEKCPSILYLNVYSIKENYDFLLNSDITISNINSCLHILSTEPNRLRETYYYVLENYGISVLNFTTSILSHRKDYIIEIERTFNKNKIKDKKIIMSACIQKIDSTEIEKIIKVCRENNIEITGSVFLRTSKEIEKIIKICKENNIEITGSVFLRTSEEIEEIIKVCGENNIEITGSIFKKPAEEIEKIIKVCKDNKIEITGSVFMKPAKEIEEIIKICKDNKIEITSSVFKKPAKKTEEIIKVCKDNKIEITGSVFLKPAKEIEKTCLFIKENYDERFLKRLIVIRDKDYLEKVFDLLKNYNVLDTVITSSSILGLKYDEIRTRILYLEENDIPICDNAKKFNSIFGMNDTRMKSKYGVTQKNLNERYLEKESEKKL